MLPAGLQLTSDYNFSLLASPSRISLTAVNYKAAHAAQCTVSHKRATPSGGTAEWEHTINNDHWRFCVLWQTY